MAVAIRDEGGKAALWFRVIPERDEESAVVRRGMK